MYSWIIFLISWCTLSYICIFTFYLFRHILEIYLFNEIIKLKIKNLNKFIFNIIFTIYNYSIKEIYQYTSISTSGKAE